MKKGNKKGNGGFLKLLILLIIALALLKIVWGWDIMDFLNKPKVKEIIETMVDIVKAIWNFIKNLFSSSNN